MSWWGNFLHEMGDPSYFSKTLLGIVTGLGIWIWRQGKKIKLVYIWARDQIPKNDKEKEAIEKRQRFIDELMIKQIVEKRDCETACALSIIKVEEIIEEKCDEKIKQYSLIENEKFTSINKQLEDIKTAVINTQKAISDFTIEIIKKQST